MELGGAHNAGIWQRQEMTPEQLRRQKILAQEKDTRAIIERDFSASRMNSTKWAEVVQCLSELKLEYRVRFVDVPDKVFDVRGLRHVTGDWFDSSLSTFTAISIEWLEIDPIEKTRDFYLIPKEVNQAHEIEKRLTAISVPYHWESDLIRIIGHVRKGPCE